VKPYRLLVEWGVVQRLKDLPVRTQRGVYVIFSRLEQAPDLVSEFSMTDEKGRELDGFIHDGWAFYFWIDFADRHVKVLTIELAEGAMAGIHRHRGQAWGKARLPRHQREQRRPEVATLGASRAIVGGIPRPRAGQQTSNVEC